MASLETLPADQRAVLELVLKRGRTYDEIAKMLSIDRAGVRERALAAFDALGPQTRLAPERRALITDYLLGQLPPRVSEDTRQRLAQSASERAWARVLASELAPLSASPLPEIPTDGARESRRPEAAVAAGEPAAASGDPTRGAAADPAPAAAAGSAAKTQPRGLAARPSSRRGGMILLALGALAVIAAVVVIALISGGSSKHNSSTTASQPSAASTAPASSTSTTSSTPSTSTSTTTANGAHLVAQINLTAPTSANATKPVGVALVLKQGNNTGIAIRAQNLPANGKQDAYAVWLFKSASDTHLLGFVNPAVGANGVLQAESALPTNAAHFSQLLVTRETQQNPRSPGDVVLRGALKGLS